MKISEQLKNYFSFTAVFLLSLILSVIQSFAQWEQTGPVGGRVLALAASGNTVFASMEQTNYVQVSTNFGITWQPTSLYGYINSFAISGDTIYAATALGINISTDNGKSWIYRVFSNPIIRCMAFSGGYLFVGTYSNGLYISADYGQTWNQSSAGSGRVDEIAVSGSTLFISFNNSVLRSTNYGMTWSASLNNVEVYSLLISGSNVFAGTASSGIFLSTNGGMNWNSAGWLQSVYELHSSGGKIFAGNWNGVHSSSDNGASWIFTGLSGDVHTITSSGTNLYAGSLTEFGISLSTNAGATWTEQELYCTNVNEVAVSGGKIAEAVNEKGILLSTNNGTNWTSTSLTNPFIMAVAISGEKIFAAGQIDLHCSTDNGVNWNHSSFGLTRYFTSVAYGSNYVYAGTDQITAIGTVFRSSNNGSSWSQTSLNKNVLSLETIGNYVLAGTTTGVSYSANQGGNWFQSDLTNRSVNDFDVDGNTLYAGTSGGIFKSSNSGLNWFYVGPGNISCIAASGNIIFAGVYEHGIKLSTNYGQSWEEYGSGIPPEITITSLVMQNGYVLAGTQGNSTYRIPIMKVGITVAVEGLYNISSGSLNKRDTLRAYLRSSVSPYNVIDSSSAIVDSISLTGSFDFFNAHSGTYYISVKYRNSVETWSKAGGESFSPGVINEYNFTSSVSQAFGNNLVLKGTRYCIYSGDINSDGTIDLTDLISISNDAALFVTGYNNTDLNGDGYTDHTDLLIAFNNSVNYINLIRP